MKNSEPEKLPNKTPDWFRQWYNLSFWHFQYKVENKLGVHDKLLWLVLSAIIIASVADRFL